MEITKTRGYLNKKRVRTRTYANLKTYDIR